MAADDESSVAVEETIDQPPAETQELGKTFTLKILQLIKEAHQQHGLRHGDYQRYRSYCTRRLRRLRKALHFVQGTKHRFQQKKVTEAVLTDVKFLYIPLVMAERAWGFAMQLKQEANTEPRKRFHLLERLCKAAKHTEELEKLCESSKCDARTKLEAQAYAAWMKGTLQFELQQWEATLEHFRKAQTIYEKLSAALNEEEQVFYRQRVDEITPNIRYCSYNIGDESAINDLKELRLTVGEDILASKLDALIAQTREKEAATLSEVTWRGRTIPVKHEKIRVFLLNVQESDHEIHRAHDLESKVSVYDSLLLECKDCLQVLRDELKNDPSFKSRTQTDGPISSQHFLHSYLLYIRLNKTIERNLLMVEALRKQLTHAETSSEGKKVVRPQDLIRLYETIIQNLNEILLLPSVSEDAKFTEVINKKILAYKAFRCYFLAQAFGANKKWVEAMALYDRTQSYIQQALKNKKNIDKNLIVELEELLQTVDGQKYSAHSLSVLAAESPVEPIEKTSLKNRKPLYERLDEYYEDPSLLSKQPNIAPFPPSFEAIPCKPLFFDLALNHMELPDLEAHLEQKKGGGITGLVKGWLWGSGGKK